MRVGFTTRPSPYVALHHRVAVTPETPEPVARPSLDEYMKKSEATFMPHYMPGASQEMIPVYQELFADPEAADPLLEQLSAEGQQGKYWNEKAVKLVGALDWAFQNGNLTELQEKRLTQLLRPTLAKPRGPDYLNKLLDSHRERLLNQESFADTELQAVASSAFRLREKTELVESARAKLTPAQRESVVSRFEEEMQAEPKVNDRAKALFYLAGAYEEHQERFLPHVEALGGTLMKVLAKPLMENLTTRALSDLEKKYSDPVEGPQAFIDSLVVNRQASVREVAPQREQQLLKSWSQRVGPWILEPQQHFHKDQMLAVYDYLKDKGAPQWERLKNSQAWVNSTTDRMMLTAEGSRHLSAAHYRTEFHPEFPGIVERAMVPMHMNLKDALEFSVEVTHRMEQGGISSDEAYHRVLQEKLELPGPGEEGDLDLGMEFEEDLVIFDGIALPVYD